MGLFSKRPPCAVCGGKVSGLFPWKIEGQYVCNLCHGLIDVQDGGDRMTMAQFLEYRDFRAENQKLKQDFTVTQKFDFGLLDTKILFDEQHRRFCMDKNLDRTIFLGAEVESFRICEDNAPLFEGDARGLCCYQSDLPQRLSMLAPQIQMIAMQRQMQRDEERRADEEGRPRPPYRCLDMPEPLHAFNVEIRLRHPYWSVLTCDRDAPRLDSDYPDLDRYMDAYNDGADHMYRLAQALLHVAFPGAPEYAAGAAAPAGTAAAAAQPADTAAELKKYKQLLDEGILTEAEFTAKKKQLLGI